MFNIIGPTGPLMYLDKIFHDSHRAVVGWLTVSHSGYIISVVRKTSS